MVEIFGSQVGNFVFLKLSYGIILVLGLGLGPGITSRRLGISSGMMILTWDMRYLVFKHTATLFTHCYEANNT